jgi:hypothetical protein
MGDSLVSEIGSVGFCCVRQDSVAKKIACIHRLSRPRSTRDRIPAHFV